MAKMSHFSRSRIMLLILIGWLQLAWMVSITLANERKFDDLGRAIITQAEWDNATSEQKETVQAFCADLCYEVYNEEKINKTREEKKKELHEIAEKIYAEYSKRPKDQDQDKLNKLRLENVKLRKFEIASCESTVDKTVKQNPRKTKEEVLKECIDSREIICGSCIKHMHIRNPLAICLIILLILLIIGGIALGVMFSMKKGPFKKRQANIYNPNAQQANPQTSNPANLYEQSGNPDQSYGPGPAGEPSHSPTQNFVP